MSEVDDFYKSIASIYKSEWRKYSNCCGESSVTFFDDNSIDEAKAMCNSCPVAIECLDDAMFYEDEGVRGGLSYSERISLALHRKRYQIYFRKDALIEG